MTISSGVIVTAEFYARVTTAYVTAGRTLATDRRIKRAACRWLRSSRYNIADQTSIVIESLC
ncbi:hypothetical protein DYE20_07785 [[Mycobacterium] chelonae subsp. gwanakae]|uniref:Uncharacterized protein n=1 Tax=Mycobacteroides chelonae TaxID=1774 RepID=A0AB73TZY6_MYCCH|nr:hypothetical protein DYE20_07785 [[Mycobacterium] chelonae subsp. gwanakae]QDF70083.1 hypothetical protein FJK96_07945 [Mycobacteroides chelonae]